MPMNARSSDRSASPWFFRRSSSWRTRTFIDPAAAWVKVTAAMRSTETPLSIAPAISETSMWVLPVPADASTKHPREVVWIGGVMVAPGVPSGSGA